MPPTPTAPRNSATFTYGDANTDTQDGAQLAFSDWSGNSDQSAANTYSTEFTANAIAASQSTANFLGNAGTPSSTTDESLNMILIPQTLTAATAYASAATDAKPNGSYIALKMVIKNNTDAGETVADATTDGIPSTSLVEVTMRPTKIRMQTSTPSSKALKSNSLLFLLMDGQIEYMMSLLQQT